MEKKTLRSPYTTTLIVFTAILLWGLSGVLGGGGHTYWLFSFYAIIPGTIFICASVLGFQNAPRKWLYPLLSGVLARGIVHAVFLHPSGTFSRVSWFPYSPFLPLLFALAGMLLGIATRIVTQKMSASPRMRLKKAAKAAAILGLVIALIHVVHALTLDRIIEYKEVSFHSETLAPALDGYRIGFLTDTHFMTDERLWEVVDELNQRDLDLLLLGGDFAVSTAIMQRTVEILSHIQTTDGIYGVEGNHDNHTRLFAAMEAHGMIPLSNSGVSIRENLFLAGVEDLWNRNPNVAHAIADASPDDFVLLLSHNPDVSMQQDTAGIDLVLSGHTHGGQITFFGIWAPYLTLRSSITDYNQRFRAGWAESRDGTPVYVSRGVGEYLPRVFARPQVILMTLYNS